MHKIYQCLIILETPIKEKNVKQKTLTPRQFYSYSLQLKDLKKVTINHCGRLFQEYVVDNYCKIEQQRLFFIENNQKHLRAELYNDLQDLRSKKVKLGDVGKRIILPSSFHGGPRHMHQLYQVNNFTIIRIHLLILIL
jgi:hypothetical protein